MRRLHIGRTAATIGTVLDLRQVRNYTTEHEGYWVGNEKLSPYGSITYHLSNLFQRKPLFYSNNRNHILSLSAISAQWNNQSV